MRTELILLCLMAGVIYFMMKNKTVKNVTRKSKYIIFDFGNNFYTILHLGMSGTLHIPSNKNITNLRLKSKCIAI